MGNGYQTVLEALEEQELVSSRGPKGITAKCPSHEDGRASLSLSEGDDGRALLLCFAGCDTPDVVKALGLNMRDLFGDRASYDAAQYVYTDEQGDPLIRVTRTWPKGFRQERWDPDSKMWSTGLKQVRRTVYNLPAVAQAEKVWIVEGEKDVETLRQEGIVATTPLGGANKWRDEYVESLRGKILNIVADNDKPGIESALRIKNALRTQATVEGVWINPDGKDVTDLYTQGKGLGDLERYVAADATQFEPMDWEDYDPGEIKWLMDKYIPVQARVLAFGAAGSLKSLWAMWVATKLCEEGHSVAYFSMEMAPREVARRLQSLAPDQDRFKLFRRIAFNNAADLEAACDLLKGFSLIVIDSFSSVPGMNQNSNDDMAAVDREFFLPLIEETGASLLILDNTGQDIVTDKGVKQQERARGASAKGDKMDLTIMFDRPDEEDNHKCRIRVKKMRLDVPTPKPVVVRAAPGEIDFRMLDEHGADMGSMWQAGELPPPPSPKPDAPESILDKLKRLKREANDTPRSDGEAGGTGEAASEDAGSGGGPESPSGAEEVGEV